MSNSVTTTFFADERAASAAISRLEKKILDLENKHKQLSQQSRRGNDDVLSGLKGWVANLGSVALGYAALPNLIGHVIAANREMYEQADQIAIKYDALFRRFRVQSGFSAVKTEEARGRITEHALRAGVPLEYAETVAEELAGEGFDATEASGPALKTILETVRATGMGEVDPRELAKAAAMFLSAQGKDKTDANLRPVMVAIQRLFKETSLKLEDLVSLAGKTEAAAGSLTTPETLAVFDLLRQKNPADVASTAFKIIIDRLQTIKARPADAAMLRKIGLRPKDVDLVGEDIFEVLDRLAAGLDKVSPEVQNMVMSGIFEERARAPATGLIRDRSKLKDIMAKMGDVAGFEKDVEIATSGRAVGRARSDSLREMLVGERDTGFESLLKASETIALEKGASPFAISSGLAMSRMAKWLGFSDETAFSMAAGGTLEAVSGPGEGSGLEQARRRLEGLESNSEETVNVLKDILEELRKRPMRREGVGAP